MINKIFTKIRIELGYLFGWIWDNLAVILLFTLSVRIYQLQDDVNLLYKVNMMNYNRVEENNRVDSLHYETFIKVNDILLDFDCRLDTLEYSKRYD